VSTLVENTQGKFTICTILTVKKHNVKKIIVILFLLGTIFPIKSQNKEILGDTAFWYKRSVALYNELGLQDLEKSTDDFHFRFTANDYRIIDIWQNNDSIGGRVINYIGHSYGFRNRKHKIVSKIQNIEKQTLEQVYKFVFDSAILDLPSDNNIKGWRQGADGIEYFVEHSNKQKYFYKHYWTPSVYARDSLPEAIFLISFINQLDTLLNLTKSYKNFRENLPKMGCYGAGMLNMCYASNPLWIGYVGSIKLPFGVNFSKNFGYIGNVKTGFGFRINYRFNGCGNYDFFALGGKSDLFFRKPKLSDVIIYLYRQRRFENAIFYNNKVSYTLRFAKLNIGAGVDFLNENKQNKIGAIANIGYAFPQFFWLDVETSFFKQNIDYKVDISKYLFHKFNCQFDANIFYERFQNHNDFGFGLTVSL